MGSNPGRSKRFLCSWNCLHPPSLLFSGCWGHFTWSKLAGGVRLTDHSPRINVEAMKEWSSTFFPSYMPSWCAQGDFTFLHIIHTMEVTESSVLVSAVSVNVRQTADSYITTPHMYLHGLERDTCCNQLCCIHLRWWLREFLILFYRMYILLFPGKGIFIA